MTNQNSSPQKEKTKILIIKRDESVAGVYQKKLLSAGYEVKIINQPDENFLREIIDFDPDLIVLGIIITAKISGLDIIKRLRSEEKTKDVKIMILTTVDDPESIREARKFQIEDYLVSTLYSPESIEKKVGEILRK